MNIRPCRATLPIYARILTLAGYTAIFLSHTPEITIPQIRNLGIECKDCKFW